MENLSPALTSIRVFTTIPLMRAVLVSMNDIGTYSFDALAESMDLVGLFTVRERGRHYMDIADFTAQAQARRVPVYTIGSINDPEAAGQLRALKPDYVFSLGWKQIIKEPLLAIPKIGWIGGHPAWLRLKGEAADPAVLSAPGNEPLQYAIRGRFSKTGMTLIWVQAKIDAGEVFARGDIPLDVEHETSWTLLQKVGRMTAGLLRANMPALLAGRPPRLAQEMENLQPYMKPLHPEDNRIDPAASADDAYRLIRSCIYPYPNAFLEFHGQRIYVEEARLENGVFTGLKVRAGGTPWGP
jgi:methionyl-tRNA formyltransferase